MATSNPHPGRSTNTNAKANVKSRFPQRGQHNPISQTQHTQQVDSGWGGRDTHTHNTTSAPATVNTNTGGPRREEKERALHPSWEAKRKQKEKQSSGILPSQGTKIKF